VKQLYKLTNKRNAAKQIGTRVRRLERAQAAFHRRKLREKQYGLQSNKPHYETSRDKQSDPSSTNDSDLRYFISPSQNEWFDIYALLKSRSADPAYKVSVSYDLLVDPNLDGYSVGLLAKTAGPSPWSPAWSRL